MANTTYALVTSLIPQIWEGALNYAKPRFVMPSRVSIFTDEQGMTPRNVSEYAETGGVKSVAETVDITSTAMSRALLSTLTPAEYGKMIALTDQRVETDPERVVADAAIELGYTMGKNVELRLLGLINSLTGGAIGDGSAAFDLSHLFKARALMEVAGVPGPYVAVLHPYHFLDVATDLITTSKTPADSLQNQVIRGYYIDGLADVEIVVAPLAHKAPVHTVTITGSPTGGTFTLSVDNVAANGAGPIESGNIAYNANAATIQAAVEALANVTAGDVVVTGTNPFTFTWAADAYGDTPTLTADGALLTGGTSPDVTIAEASAKAKGGFFRRDSFALDMRRGLRIEPDRDASARLSELNATMVYAYGGWRLARGVTMNYDATAPA